MQAGDLEYVALRLARRFCFTADRLNALGRFLPYYRVNQGQLDPWPIADAYADALARSSLPLAGQRVLELGSGATNGVGYALAARHDCRVICLEPFARFDPALDARLRSAVAARYPQADFSRVTRLTDLAAIPDASLDIVASNSVLEHVADPAALFADLARVLAPGGVMVHRVDYRDHFFKYPYHFLKFSKRIWDRWLDPGDLPRWRLDDHLAALARAGFRAALLDARRDQPAFDAVAPSLHADFRRRDPVMLAVSTAVIWCEKDASGGRGGSSPPDPLDKGTDGGVRVTSPLSFRRGSGGNAFQKRSPQALRLLLLNYEYPPLGGGAGNATANMAREMATMGHAVRVVTAAFRGLPRREVVDGYELWRIPAVRRHADHCSPVEMLSFMASAMLALPVMARAWRPAACVAFFGIPCGPAAWVLEKLWGVPYVVSLRGGDVPGFQPYDLAGYHRLTGPLIRFLWRSASHVVANSQGLAELARRSAGDTPILMIPNGVDTDRFHPAADKSGQGPVRLLFVGRVVRQKGLDVLLAALARLPQEADWTLTVVGDGPLRPVLAAEAARLGVARRIEFAGWTSREAMPGLYREADAFVFPSRDEGMPNALLEAMASGLPAVATAISGNQELILHGETGFLVPPEDAQALAEVLSRLLADPALRRNLGAAGRRKAETEYSWRSVAQRYLELCNPSPFPPAPPSRGSGGDDPPRPPEAS